MHAKRIAANFFVSTTSSSIALDPSSNHDQTNDIIDNQQIKNRKVEDLTAKSLPSMTFDAKESNETCSFHVEHVSRITKKIQMIVRAIKNQMIWKRSCSTGSAKWSWEGECTFLDLLIMLKMPENTKAFRAKKITPSEFESCFECITKRIRYGSLRITGKHVNFLFRPDENILKINGWFGI